MRIYIVALESLLLNGLPLSANERMELLFSDCWVIAGVLLAGFFCCCCLFVCLSQHLAM
jgi:hypothetical protein